MSKEERRLKFLAENPPKESPKSFHYTITFDEKQNEQVKKAMEKYGGISRSNLFAMLVALDLAHKSPGRPPSAKQQTEEEADLDFILNKPDFTNDLPKMYYNGAMRGPKEIAWEDEKDRRIKKHGTL